MSTYLDVVGGLIRQLAAIATSAGAADADKLVRTGATGRLDASLMPSSGVAGVWGSWQTLTLLNSWVIDTTFHANRQTNHYRVRGTELDLAICAKNTAAQLGKIAELPVGARPTFAWDLVGGSDLGNGLTSAGWIAIQTNGDINIRQLANVNGNAYLVVRGVIQLS
jgi:hypothetical protein